MNLLKSGSFLNLDKNKNNILFLMFNKNKNKSLEKSYGLYHILYNKLKYQFNIVIISDVGEPLQNEFVINKSFFKNNNKPNLLYECFDNIFKNIHFSYVFNCGELRLPLGCYSKDHILRNSYNEFFDYVNKDSVNLENINLAIDKVEKKFYNYVALSAFSNVRSALAYLLEEYFENKSDKIYSAVIDPVYSYVDHFKKKPTLLYFTDDFRGSRKYHKFDIPQFQLSYQNKLNSCSIEKSKLFIWYGSLFYNKGTKKDIYDLFLKDIQHNMDFFCPLVFNSWRKNDKNNEEKLKKYNLYDLYISVKNHKNYKGYIDNENLISTISTYKYGLITRCISIYDSLNFRPVYYSYLNILPFFDYKYDPEYLYIPKNIQDKLVVKNSKDIDRLIDYYENNNDKRLELLNELKQLFKYNEYVNDTENTINKEIKRIIPEFKELFNFNNIDDW